MSSNEQTRVVYLSLGKLQAYKSFGLLMIMILVFWTINDLFFLDSQTIPKPDAYIN